MDRSSHLNLVAQSRLLKNGALEIRKNGGFKMAFFFQYFKFFANFRN